MPSTLDPGDRKLLLIAGAILLAVDRRDGRVCPVPRRSRRPGNPNDLLDDAKRRAGCLPSAAMSLGYRSERWEKSPAELPADCGGKDSDSRGPINFPDKQEREALLTFRAFRRLDHLRRQFSISLHSKAATSTPNPATRLSSLDFATAFRRSSPSPFTRGAPKSRCLRPTGGTFRMALRFPCTVTPEEPVVVTWRLGKGPYSLVGRAHAGHQLGNSRRTEICRFFLDCIQAVRPGASPARQRFLWDEYFHGYRGSLWDYFAGDAGAVGDLSTGVGGGFRFAGVWAQERTAVRAGRCVPAFAAGICRYPG